MVAKSVVACSLLHWPEPWAQTAGAQVTVAVCVFAFDLLYADGEPMVGRSLRERRAALDRAFPNKCVRQGMHLCCWRGGLGLAVVRVQQLQD